MRHLRLLVELRSIQTAAERVLHYLRVQADARGRVRLPAPLISGARELGMAHETFYRSLAELEKSGTLRRLDTLTFVLTGPFPG